MNLKQILAKYPITNNNWWLEENYSLNRDIELTTSNRGNFILNTIGIHGYFKRIRSDIGNDDVYNSDPWLREFKVYNHAFYKIAGVGSGYDVWVMTTSVEGNKIWCMDVFER